MMKKESLNCESLPSLTDRECEQNYQNPFLNRSYIVDFQTNTVLLNGEKFGDIESHDKKNKTLTIVRNFPPYIKDQKIFLTYDKMFEYEN